MGIYKLAPAARLARIELETVFGTTTVFSGFTAATGSSYENHDILAWTFEDAFSPDDGDRTFIDGFDAG